MLPPSRGRSPSGGACPAGAKTISFSAEKETVLDSKEKVRPVYGGVGTRKTTASSFRMTGRTPSGRYGLPLWNRERPAVLTTRRLRVPLSGPGTQCILHCACPWGAASQTRRGRHLFAQGELHATKEPIAALCRESGTTRRPQDRTTVFSLFRHGMAVTAGTGPQTVRKAESHRFPSTNAP